MLDNKNTSAYGIAHQKPVLFGEDDASTEGETECDDFEYTDNPMLDDYVLETQPEESRVVDCVDLLRDSLVKDEFYGSCLSFYQRADPDFPIFKSVLSKNLDFNIPYIDRVLLTDEEDDIFLSNLIADINCKLDEYTKCAYELDLVGVSVLPDETHEDLVHKNLLDNFVSLLASDGNNFTKDTFIDTFKSVYGEDAGKMLSIISNIMDADR